ncbi:MAG: sigma-70 family RNA polymerase sigma factor [Kofleriaceae bacterium]
MAGFPETRPSAVVSLRSDDLAVRSRGLGIIAQVYRAPACAHVRLKFRITQDEAEDIVQAFFLRIVERNILSTFNPEGSRFRTYLRCCLDNFAIDRRRADARHSRGRDGELEPADPALAVPPDADPELFDRAWVRRVAEVAIERLIARLDELGKPIHAELFRRFHLADEPPAYDVVAAELAISVGDVTNWLHVARREFRRVALELLRELTASEDEFVDEARAVFGIEVKRG